MNPGQNSTNVGEGSSRQIYVPLDNEGQFLDLNQSYEDENINELIDAEKLDEFQNAGKGSN